ncbi:hypothetical protein BGW42_000861 [Actinomortierella wolfii]|nr:hypothetical protein BGW42_000861 [Actinomortierella wolfii]
MSAVLSTLVNPLTAVTLRQAIDRYLAYAQSRSRFELTLVGLGFLLVATMLKYPDRAIGTRSRRDIPGDRGLPLVGNLFQILWYKDDVLEYFMDQVKRHGKIFTFSLPGLGRTIQITSPELIDDGAEWRMQRKTASNVFTTRLFRDLVQHAFKETAYELGKNFVKYEARSTASDPYYFDLQQEFAKMTLDAFGKVSFGLEFNALSQESNSEFGQAFDFMNQRIQIRIIDPFWKLSEWINPSLRRNVRASMDIMNKYAYMAIAKRRSETPKEKETRRKDLLDYFINYEHEDGTGLSDVELRDMFMNFMIAGRDTTSQALAWMFYHLKKYPEIQAKMREEIDAVFPQNSDDYSYDIIAREMPYVKAVFYETLRLFPPVAISGVFAFGPDVLPNGTRVDAGDLIGFSSYCMARVTDIWGPDAYEFRPERWLISDNTTKSPFGKFKNENSFKFNSFNGGPRICLGQQFSTLEAMVTTIYVLQNFEFELMPNHPTPVPKPALTTPIAGGLHVRVYKRHTDELADV